MPFSNPCANGIDMWHELCMINYWIGLKMFEVFIVISMCSCNEQTRCSKKSSAFCPHYRATSVYWFLHYNNKKVFYQKNCCVFASVCIQPALKISYFTDFYKLKRINLSIGYFSAKEGSWNWMRILNTLHIY